MSDAEQCMRNAAVMCSNYLRQAKLNMAEIDPTHACSLTAMVTRFYPLACILLTLRSGFPGIVSFTLIRYGNCSQRIIFRNKIEHFQDTLIRKLFLYTVIYDRFSGWPNNTSAKAFSMIAAAVHCPMPTGCSMTEFLVLQWNGTYTCMLQYLYGGFIKTWIPLMIFYGR